MPADPPSHTEETPYGPETLVIKVGGGMFAAAASVDPDSVALKADPDLAEFLREQYPGIRPGYHINKRHWNTVALDGSVPTDVIRLRATPVAPDGAVGGRSAPRMLWHDSGDSLTQSRVLRTTLAATRRCSRARHRVSRACNREPRHEERHTSWLLDGRRETSEARTIQVSVRIDRGYKIEGMRPRCSSHRQRRCTAPSSSPSSHGAPRRRETPPPTPMGRRR